MNEMPGSGRVLTRFGGRSALVTALFAVGLAFAAVVTAATLGSNSGHGRPIPLSQHGRRARLAGARWTDETPSWSPNGREIVFASNRAMIGPRQRAAGKTGIDHLYLMNSDGSGVRRLTWDSGDARDPSFSPDGKRIVYVATNHEYKPEPAIDLVAADGSRRRVLTLGRYNRRALIGRGDPVLPTWSPNGRWIAFVNDLSGLRDEADLYVIRPDGTGLHRVAVNIAGGCDFTSSPYTWSPDSRELAVIGADQRVYRIAIGRRKPLQITAASCWRTFATTVVAWSPDGSQIAFVRGLVATDIWGQSWVKRRQLWIYDLKAHRLGRPRALIGSDSGDSGVTITWLGGRRPLLAVSDGGRTDLLTAAGRRIRMFRRPAGIMLRIGSASPMGRRLLFAKPLGGSGHLAIFVLDVRSGRVRQLTQH